VVAKSKLVWAIITETWHEAAPELRFARMEQKPCALRKIMQI